MVYVLKDVLHVAVWAWCTVIVLLGKWQRFLRKTEGKNDKAKRQMEKERPEENLERKKEEK